MLLVTFKITFLCVRAQRAIQAIRSVNVNLSQWTQYRLVRMTDHVSRHLVDQTVNAVKLMDKPCAHAQPVMWDHRQIVDQNVLLIPNARLIRVASIKNVVILVQTHAEYRQNVTSRTIIRYACARKDSPETRSLNAQEYVSIFKNFSK